MNDQRVKKYHATYIHSFQFQLKLIMKCTVYFDISPVFLFYVRPKSCFLFTLDITEYPNIFLTLNEV